MAAAVRVWTGLHCSLCGPARFITARAVERHRGSSGGGAAVLLDERVVDGDDVSPQHWSRRMFAHAVPVVTAVGPDPGLAAANNNDNTDDARRHQVIFAPTPASHSVSEQLLAQGIAASVRYGPRAF